LKKATAPYNGGVRGSQSGLRLRRQKTVSRFTARRILEHASVLGRSHNRCEVPASLRPACPLRVARHRLPPTKTCAGAAPPTESIQAMAALPRKLSSSRPLSMAQSLREETLFCLHFLNRHIRPSFRYNRSPGFSSRFLAKRRPGQEKSLHLVLAPANATLSRARVMRSSFACSRYIAPIPEQPEVSPCAMSLPPLVALSLPA